MFALGITRRISAQSPETQLAFRKGVRYLYAGNWGEARRLFRSAARNEPQCAMAHWGIAVAESCSSHFSGHSSAIATACDAPGASAEERELIAATACGFGGSSVSDSRRAWAAAMRRFASGRPGDADAAFLSCLATFQAYGPAQSYVPGNGPDLSVAEATHLLPDLDRIISLCPQHEGARFLRIQTLENLRRAGESYDDACSLMATAREPGLSHIMHRAAHVFAFSGRVDLSIEANIAAARNNRAYFEQTDEADAATMRGHHDHVVETTIHQLGQIGRWEEAAVLAGDDPILQSMIALRRRRWADVVDLGEPLLYARAVALAMLGRRSEVPSVVKRLKDGAQYSSSLAIQIALIGSALARADGDLPKELEYYEFAYEIDSKFPYSPPMFWPLPVIDGYGAALIRAGRYLAAERVFESALGSAPFDPYYRAGFDLAREQQAKSVDRRWQDAPLVGSWGATLSLSDLA